MFNLTSKLAQTERLLDPVLVTIRRREERRVLDNNCAQASAELHNMRHLVVTLERELQSAVQRHNLAKTHLERCRAALQEHDRFTATVIKKGENNDNAYA